MSRTRRTRLVSPTNDETILVRGERDDGCDHWGCVRWKRAERKHQRAKAKQLLRVDPDLVSSRNRPVW